MGRETWTRLTRGGGEFLGREIQRFLSVFSSPRLFIWEILHSTIRKMDKHVQKIQQELEGAKDKLEKQQHKRVTSAAAAANIISIVIDPSVG